jgi:hypothetical protein
MFRSHFLLAAAAVSILPHVTRAQTAPPIPPALVTPDQLQTSLGTLQFKDGAPSKETAAKIYDQLDLMQRRGVRERLSRRLRCINR